MAKNKPTIERVSEPEPETVPAVEASVVAPADVSPDRSWLADPLNVVNVHRLRVLGRLYRVKLKKPKEGQALIEAGSAEEAVARFVSMTPGVTAAECGADKLKP